MLKSAMYTTKALVRITPAKVVDRAKKQITGNMTLSKWFNDLLIAKKKKITDILTGSINVEVGIYDRPMTSGNGQTRWDGVFKGRWPKQPNQSVGLATYLFTPSWLASDEGDEKSAATTLIHELAHWVEAYSLGKIWPGKPPGFYDTGDYVASLVVWP